MIDAWWHQFAALFITAVHLRGESVRAAIVCVVSTGLNQLEDPPRGTSEPTP